MDSFGIRGEGRNFGFLHAGIELAILQLETADDLK